MKHLSQTLLVLLVMVHVFTPGFAQEQTAEDLIHWYESEVRPLEIAASRAWWEANTTGKDQAYAAKEQAENRLNAILADHDRFALVKSLHATKQAESKIARQIELIYLSMLNRQIDTELLQRITSKENEVEKAFNIFRGDVDGEKLTDSQVREKLLSSRDSAERKKVWEASKQVGREVEADVRQLVFLRNESATALGFKNYHEMKLKLNEQDPDEVLQLFDELDDLTREPFANTKAEIDRRLAAMYGLKVDELQAWHYHDPFFQESPDVFDVDLDRAFADADIVAACEKFYQAIGLPIDDVIARSDLYEKPGKSPHAFCTDIDRAGDVRVLANIVRNSYWMTTMLHELGHAVYSSKFIPPSQPYLLRTNSHILTTEGLAMMFERFAGDASWLKLAGIAVPDADAYNKASLNKRRNKLLIFSRWCQVMLRFEKSMYADPEQDLNKLWWDLVEKYQLVKRPADRDEPDYASKIHIVSAPCYYHNYMMGELFACQLHATIARELLGGEDPRTAIYFDKPQVGKFLIERIFNPGNAVGWDELTRQATGEPLNAKAFAFEFSE
jgi:peptidyl-dipeptidase A